MTANGFAVLDPVTGLPKPTDNSVCPSDKEGIQMDTSYSTPTPTIGKMHIDAAGSGGGVDPTLLALAGNRGGGFLGGNGENGGLLMLLLLAMFQRGGGLFGGNGAAGGDAVAAASISTSKDVMAQLNTFQSWAQNNASQLAQQCCCSTQQIMAAVSGVSDKLFQAFVAQSQAQTAQLNNTQAVLTAQATSNADAINAHVNTMEDNLNNDIHDVEKAISSGFSAGALQECQTQNLVQSTTAGLQAALSSAITSGNYALAQQLAACCCENRLAIANQNSLIEKNTASLQNQLNMQTCEIKQAISADGQATRALMNDNRMQDLQAQLADAKSAIRDQTILGAINRRCGGHRGGGGGGSGVEVDIDNVNRIG